MSRTNLRAPAPTPEDADHKLARPIAGYTPAVYRFRQTEPEKTFEHTDLDLLLAQITQFRFENELPPIPYLKEVVLDFTMRSDSAHEPYTQYYQTSHDVHLSAKEYLLGALAFTKAKLATPEDLFVSPEHAEQRALTCLNCPRHIHSVNGRSATSPSLVQSRFAQLAKGRTTTVDNALKVCGVCTCLTRAKVHFKLDFIKKASSSRLLQMFKQRYMGLNGKPHVCWIGKELEDEEKQTKAPT